jgi:hypothetical protein
MTNRFVGMQGKIGVARAEWAPRARHEFMYPGLRFFLRDFKGVRRLPLVQAQRRKRLPASLTLGHSHVIGTFGFYG